MANYNSTANVVLTVNGKQAQQMLSKLQQQATSLQKKLAAASTAGDKATMKKLQRELNNTNRLIDQLKGSASSAEQVLRRLDKASPRELQKTLRTLQAQLNGIERGSSAWNAHVAKIQLVKAELARVNATLATQQSLWTRFNGWLNNASTAIMGIAAAVAGLVMAGRKAVNAYAEMEESMANTRKYTRMTEEDVLALNEAFKGMDTRLAREQLNLLAQEGGRLGYNTIQSVKEYVEAASIINVALVDLGEGATQTIAKLSNIFGMEQMYGVKESMLKIGSTVNHLSQNCTAAKPYLVNFAQRLAGIGATAKMTIPEILAFGATLDAHGQKVEMSATALQRVIMKLFQSPKEMAKKVGLDMETFVTTINKSTSAGVMMFLEKLKEIGSDQALAVLSPLFKDLGFDGARVASVLTNLSEHLDFLKWQMGEASQAFKEGTSASNEYAIFNNTVQASIDKARKRVGELAIELGEKLYPLMRHIYTSSSAFLRVLNQIVTFIGKHRTAIGNLIIVITAYNSALLLSKTYHLLLNGVIKIGIALQTAWKTAVIMGRVVVIAFTQGIRAAVRAMQLLNATTKMNPFGIILAVVSALVIAIKALSNRMSDYQKKLREAVHSAGLYNKELREEMNNLDTLFGKLEAAKKGTKEYASAKDEIINQYGKYLTGLINERKEIVSLEKAYNRLAAAARISAKERAIDSSRKTVKDTFDDTIKDLGKQLQESLREAGFELKDAVKYTNRVLIGLQTEGTIDDETIKAIELIKGNLYDAHGWTSHPVNIVNKMTEAYSEFSVSMSEIEDIAKETNPLSGYTKKQLEQLLDYLTEAKQNGTSARIITGINEVSPGTISLTAKQLDEYIAEAEARLSALDYSVPDVVAGNPDFEFENYTDYVTDADRRKQEQQARRDAIKARKEFKEQINNAKGNWEAGDAVNTAEYSLSLKSYSDYLLQKHDLELKYFNDRIKIFEDNNLQEDEDYQELLKKKEEMLKTWSEKNAKLSIHDIKRKQSSEELQLQMDYATPGNAIYGKEEALQQGLFEIKKKYLQQMRDVYNQDSEEYHSYEEQLEDAELAEKLRLQKLYAGKIKEWRSKYEYQSASERLDLEMNLLQDVYDKGLITQQQYYQAIADLKKKYSTEYMPDNAKPDTSGSQKGLYMAQQRELDQLKSLYDQGIIDKKEYEDGKARIEKAYRKKSLDGIRQFGSTQTNQLLDIYEAWKNFFDSTEEDGGNWATRLASLASSVFAVMTSGMQQYSEYVQACADLETAKAEKKYDREIELAEGNSYRTAKLEKEKETELARIKNEANRKAFAMQVVQAVAQTATNALNAYGSAAAVPVIGYILAPIAAAMAVAAGTLQIATIKKQQQASEAQGYSKGGFTPDGREDEAVGVVHAGEWVASQKLTKNAATRPLLEALDYAQRNNTIGSIRMSDVSRSVMAPMVNAANSAAPTPTVVNNNVYQTAIDNSELSSTIKELKDRLNEPFVTVNTITGDLGIKKAQDDYNKLIANKSPKSRR